MPEFMQKTLAHKTQQILKSVEKGSQTGGGDSPAKISKITKNPMYLQNGPPALQNEPPGFQNHSKSWESGHPKSRKS